MIKITILIPTYNGSAYIEETLLSALNQTRKADVVIVSDDNSIDDTLEICSRYKDKISIHKNVNGPSGFVQGWNNAIKLVDDGYIAILHQDDLLAPTFLEEIERTIEQNPDVRHFFAPCNYIDGNGSVKREPDYCDGTVRRYSGIDYVEAYLSYGSPNIHRCPGVVTHKSIFDKCQYRKEAGHIADDDFFYRVGQYTDVVGILKPLASYREHCNSETGALEDAKLVSRLANDYLLQVAESKDNPCISDGIKRLFKERAEVFVFREYIASIKGSDVKLFLQSQKHKIELRKHGIRMPIKHKLVYLVVALLGRQFAGRFLFR